MTGRARLLPSRRQSQREWQGRLQVLARQEPRPPEHTAAYRNLLEISSFSWDAAFFLDDLVLCDLLIFFRHFSLLTTVRRPGH